MEIQQWTYKQEKCQYENYFGKNREAGKDHKYSVKPDYEATDLLSAVRIILNKKSEENRWILKMILKSIYRVR